jgi:hypothetical protein
MSEQGQDSPHASIRAEMGRLEDRIIELERELGDTRVELARLQGSVGVLEGAYQRAANIVASQAIADAEVRRSTATLAAGRVEGSARRLDMRALRQLAGALAALIAALAAAVASGKC